MQFPVLDCTLRQFTFYTKAKCACMTNDGRVIGTLNGFNTLILNNTLQVLLTESTVRRFNLPIRLSTKSLHFLPYFVAIKFLCT